MGGFGQGWSREQADALQAGILDALKAGPLGFGTLLSRLMGPSRRDSRTDRRLDRALVALRKAGRIKCDRSRGVWVLWEKGARIEPGEPVEPAFKCTTHRTYRALRRPRITPNYPAGCPQCWKIWQRTHNPTQEASAQ